MDKVVKREVVLEKDDAFWHSVDVMDLTPTQRKHFKKIMREEVRK